MSSSLFWFCGCITRDAKGTWSSASLLHPTTVDMTHETPHDAFYMNAEARIPVQCEVMGYSEFSSSVDDEGNPVTLFDGERARNDLGADAIDAAENRFPLRFTRGDVPLGGPVLVSTDPQARFFCHPLIVHVPHRTLADLPDFVANVAETRVYEDVIRGDWYERPPQMHSDEVQAKGEQSPVTSSLVLPISSIKPGTEEPAALLLDRRIAGEDNRFAARLFAFHEIELHAGMLFCRRVVYCDGAHTLSRDVARVVSADHS